MKTGRKHQVLGYLVAYYGVLQTFHLIFLSRAGLLLISGGQVPFPASPPPGGWTGSTLPFLLGMGAVDVIAASLGVYFSLKFFFQERLDQRIGWISLSIALSSGVIYLFGTLPSGAWQANLISYLIVVLFFSPITALAFLLFRSQRSE